MTKKLIESLASQLVDTPDPNRAQVIASRLQAAVRRHIEDLRLNSVRAEVNGTSTPVEFFSASLQEVSK